MVDENGGMLNDPVLLKIAEDKYWFSISDSDLIYWIKGLAWGLNLNAKVTEPDVSPLAVQGPRSDDLLAKIIGDHIRDLGFFRFKKFNFNSQELIIARSGYSKQGGFEIYVDDFSKGEEIWDTLFEAGRDLDVRAGCPNLIERIESGLLSFGSDMTNDNTPHESGLSKFCDTRNAIKCVGRDALLKEIENGPWRQIRFLSMSGPAVPPCRSMWEARKDNVVIGRVSSAAWSPDFQTNVAIGMIHREHWDPNASLIIETPDGPREAQIMARPFVQ